MSSVLLIRSVDGVLDADLPACLMLEPAIESGKSCESRVGRGLGSGGGNSCH